MNDPREKRRIEVDNMIHSITISLNEVRKKAQYSTIGS